eukprot:TRINITY_DN6124_c4_g1_i1.p1 TRINITY_DN6124_c4_g1~~TRINITY_DN6124_c4_g1_i1.p1  ORF type:complete len:164 (-),score=22.67 TRINITY_DN6124_c4_g1_i1:877-1368(-)
MEQIFIKAFNELTPLEIYTILQLRHKVFDIEQNIKDEDDIDGVDVNCFHIFIRYGDEDIVAYGRILIPNLDHGEEHLDSPTCAFGRLLVVSEHRGKGLAKKIVGEIIEFTKKKWGVKVILIHAQAYLKDFYESFGFEVRSEPFIEAGIPHLKMELEFLGSAGN